MTENVKNQEEASMSSEERALDLLKQGMDYYHRPRVENEINLVEKVRSLFLENGKTEEEIQAAFDNSRFVKEAMERHSHAQQFNLNRYLCDQLSIAETEGQDTRLLRYQLLYEINPSEWLSIFEKSVLPNMLEIGLPKAP